MYLEPSNLDGLGFSISSLTKKLQAPFKHTQKKAAEIKKVTAAVATIPGPWQAITVPVAAGAQLIPEKARKASGAAPAPVAAPGALSVPQAAKIAIPLLGLGALAFFLMR